MKPHNSANIEKRFVISISLTFIILIGEIVGGLWTGSLALLSDAAHVFMDIFALVLSYLALRLSSRPADEKHTYGWHRLEVLAALLNGFSLIVIAIGIWYEAFQRWFEPHKILGLEMLAIAAVGLLVNLIVAFILGGHDISHNGHEHHDVHNHAHNTEEPHRHKDLNLQGAFLHVIGDAISSVGVIIAGIIIWQTGWFWVDPLASALIGTLILFNAARLTRSALHILVEGTPAGLSLQNVNNDMASVPGVSSIHDLHVWSICSGHIALSAHIVLNESFYNSSEPIMADIKNRLQSRYGIEHTTIQFESSPCIQHADCSPCK